MMTTLKIRGMTCAACATRLERVLTRVEGVSSASVSLAAEEARVAGGALDAVIAAVGKAGFQAIPVNDDDDFIEADRIDAKDRRRALFDLWLAAALTAPLMIAMALHWGGIHGILPAWAQLGLAAPVQFWVGRRFYRGAWASLRGGEGNMDVLVALGTSAAFGLSVWAMGAGGPLYFESSATVITLVLAGKVMEARARTSASGAVRALMALAPEMAWIEQDGAVVAVPVRSVAVGDIVVVKPGERFAVDGTVLSGQSEADESLVTGESHGIVKDIGALVLAGSTNGTGLLRVQAVRVGRQSTIGRIAALVRDASAVKAPIERLVDRVSAWFVAGVVVLALLTLAGWGGAGRIDVGALAAIAVLVAACPCALGLATPAAVMVGVGLAAQRGILVKGPQSFEAAAGIGVVVFDKTGTLTVGHPTVTEWHAFDGDPARMLRLAASLQSGAEHPLARAVLGLAEAEGVTWPAPETVTAVPGLGVEGVVEGTRVTFGNARFMAQSGFDLPEIDVPPGTTLWLAANGRIIGVIGVADAERPEAASAIRALERLGVASALLTGDRWPVAQAVAGRLGISRIRAEAAPTDKLDYVSELRAQGSRVAMVGDGINDAPALKAADLGIAMGQGTDAAMAAADMVLLRDDPRLVAEALVLSARVVAKIKQNLFWAFIYNILVLPAAAFGLLTPVIAGAAMAASSVCVVGNALLLRRFGGKR